MKSQKKLDLQRRKTIHFTILTESHAALRIACFKNKLSMQEVFEEFAQRIAAEDPDMLEMLNDIAIKKRNKEEKKFSETDAETLFNMIEKENPFSGD